MRLTRLALELQERGVEVVSFAAGEPDFASPRVAVDAASRALREGFTKYTALWGTTDLRTALAERHAREHGAPWTARNVLVTVGAKAALFELALALFEAGMEVVVPSPCWVSFPDQIRLAGAEPVLAETVAEDDFTIRAEPILAALSDRTRAVVLNSPCNPTGGVAPAAELERIVAACAERDVVAIVDETYERFYYDGRQHASSAVLAARYPDTVVLVGSFSKTYAMTGWRVGYAAGPEWVMRAAATVQSHATSNATSFAMPGAQAALAGAEADVRAMTSEYQARRDLMVSGLAALPGVTCQPPVGAFYAFPRVSALYGGDCADSVALAERLLEEARVAVVPGAAFGADEHVRLSFACSREQIAEGLERFAAFLR